MKTEFLQNLGITEQSVIDQIMAENGRDVNKVKGEIDTYKDKIKTLEDEVKTKTSTIQDLESKVGDVEKLQTKISDLESDNTKLKNDLDTKVSEMSKNYNIENGVRDAKAKNVKAVMALLDMSKITYENGELSGLSEQLESLKGSDDTSFLFGDSKGAPKGTEPNNPPQGGNGGNPSTGKSFADAIAQALKNN